VDWRHPCQDFDGTSDDFPTFLNRPQEKVREFSWITGHLHLPVLALRMHEGYS
jgi:hypothetical protein